MKKAERRLTPVEKKEVKDQIQRAMGTNLELKYVNSYLTAAASTSTAIVTGCTDIAQGDTDVTRNGDRVKLVGTAELRAAVFSDIATGDVTQSNAFIRMILFQWHPTSESGGATEPTPANLLLTGPSGAVDVYSFYNHDQRQNYVILYDEVHKLTGVAFGAVSAITGNTGTHQYISRQIPLNGKVRAQMQFNAGSTVIASNHIYLLSISNLAADAQNPTLIWNVKIFFRDG